MDTPPPTPRKDGKFYADGSPMDAAIQLSNMIGRGLGVVLRSTTKAVKAYQDTHPKSQNTPKTRVAQEHDGWIVVPDTGYAEPSTKTTKLGPLTIRIVHEAKP